jgi:hypothetical protein
MSHNVYGSGPWPGAGRLIEVAGTAKRLSAAIHQGMRTTAPDSPSRLPGFVENPHGVAEAWYSLVLALYDEPPGLQDWFTAHADHLMVVYCWPYKWHNSVVQPLEGIWNLFKGLWPRLPKIPAHPDAHPLWHLFKNEPIWEATNWGVFFGSDRVPSLTCWRRGPEGWYRELVPVDNSPPPERHEFQGENRLVRVDEGIPAEWLTALNVFADQLRSAVNTNAGNSQPAAGGAEPGVMRTAVTMQKKRFRIALSFPGERRAFVEQVATRLGARVGRERVLYDKYYEAEFARPDLDTYLQQLYHEQSELIAVFLCADYERKEWCGLEWRAIRDLIKRRQASTVMPLRFDNTEIPGLFSTDGYVWIGNRTPDDIAKLILERVGAR